MMGITIKKTDGTNWAADQITVGGTNEQNEEMVAFMLNGEPNSFKASDIAEIVVRQPTVTTAEDKAPDTEETPPEEKTTGDTE